MEVAKAQIASNLTNFTYCCDSLCKINGREFVKVDSDGFFSDAGRRERSFWVRLFDSYSYIYTVDELNNELKSLSKRGVRALGDIRINIDCFQREDLRELRAQVRLAMKSFWDSLGRLDMLIYKTLGITVISRERNETLRRIYVALHRTDGLLANRIVDLTFPQPSTGSYEQLPAEVLSALYDRMGRVELAKLACLTKWDAEQVASYNLRKIYQRMGSDFSAEWERRFGQEAVACPRKKLQAIFDAALNDYPGFGLFFLYSDNSVERYIEIDEIVEKGNLDCLLNPPKFPDRSASDNLRTNTHVKAHLWLKRVPRKIGIMESLVYLDISGTQVRTLPKEIGNCKNLRQIIATNTPLATVPKEFGNLNLEVFEVDTPPLMVMD